MDDVRRPIREALEALKEMQKYESSYANINKIQQIVNCFAELDRVCDMLASSLGEAEGKSKEEILRECFDKAAL